ncbi:hypothetical protein J6590_042817 [Homalodisca vitripennis]|nr:hypothetical protein J6590_042817 [Homalodisca vitripennis]
MGATCPRKLPRTHKLAQDSSQTEWVYPCQLGTERADMSLALGAAGSAQGARQLFKKGTQEELFPLRVLSSPSISTSGRLVAPIMNVVKSGML